MKLVIKIGGSLLFDEDGSFNLSQFEGFAKVIKQIKDLGHELVLVVGGGVFSKSLVKMGQNLGGDRDALDRLGIVGTWVCAQLLVTALLSVAYPTPIRSERQLASLKKDDRLLVLGGLRPGQSTNAVAARVAELTKSEIIVNVTDVEGVYDKDPKQFPQARLLPKISVKELYKIVALLASEPGSYPLFDKRALDIIARTGVEVWFVNGKNPQNVPLAIEKEKIGTRVVPF